MFTVGYLICANSSPKRLAVFYLTSVSRARNVHGRSPTASTTARATRARLRHRLSWLRRGGWRRLVCQCWCAAVVRGWFYVVLGILREFLFSINTERGRPLVERLCVKRWQQYGEHHSSAIYANDDFVSASGIDRTSLSNRGRQARDAAAVRRAKNTNCTLGDNIRRLVANNMHALGECYAHELVAGTGRDDLQIGRVGHALVSRAKEIPEPTHDVH
jgi:hypothetical protein